MAAQRPEITFGSNVVVWKNHTGRSVTIKPKEYKDTESGLWRPTTSWNVSDLAHLAHCLQMAATHCINKRTEEEKIKLDHNPEGPDTLPA
jgi:hypothetical protein